MTLDAVRERDREWEPRCIYEAGWPCGLRRDFHDSPIFRHPFQYDPDRDTSAEADRRRLLSVVDAAENVNKVTIASGLTDDELDPFHADLRGALAALHTPAPL